MLTSRLKHKAMNAIIHEKTLSKFISSRSKTENIHQLVPQQANISNISVTVLRKKTKWYVHFSSDNTVSML